MTPHIQTSCNSTLRHFLFQNNPENASVHIDFGGGLEGKSAVLYHILMMSNRALDKRE